MLKRIIPYGHSLLKNTVIHGDVVIDATCGNGNDTLFLADIVGKSGHVYSFDIQAQAIESAKMLLKEHNHFNVTYIHDSHAMLDTYIPMDLHEKIGGAIFNLGYLPRSDKQIITRAESTITAIDSILGYIRKGALIVIVIYYGHEGGTEEKDAVVRFATELDQKQYAALQYQFINQKNNAPFIIAIEKR